MSLAAAAALSVSSGVCLTLSNVVISYPAHRAARALEKREERERAREREDAEPGSSSTALSAEASSPAFDFGAPGAEGSGSGDEGEQRPDDEDRWQSLKAVYFAFNLALTAAGTISNVLACGQAPVAVVFPLSVAAGLSSNLVLQQYLRLAEYDKNARVGTSILVIAVILIARLGPTELPANADMLALISTPQAGVFIGVNLVVMAGSMSALFFQWARARNNAVELLLFTLVGGTGTVLNASISKLAQMHVTAPVRLSLLAVYILLAVISVGSSIKANSELEDASLLVPISNGVNLILNCVAGFCVWGDASRLRTSNLIDYIVLYILVIVGTYLSSSFDVFRSSGEKVQAQLVHEVQERRFTQQHWGDGSGYSRCLLPKVGDDRLSRVNKLRRSLDKQLITHKDVAELLAREEFRVFLQGQGPYFVMHDRFTRKPRLPLQSMSLSSFRSLTGGVGNVVRGVSDGDRGSAASTPVQSGATPVLPGANARSHQGRFGLEEVSTSFNPQGLGEAT